MHVYVSLEKLREMLPTWFLGGFISVPGMIATLALRLILYG